ncbi:phosphorylated carbohydrates phosphatase [mine drainage metagenome]|uniref:Phosphorylated carbohydrates phosphatase n=1 Tax=mine drainage metagenome TaxID=410659 RepID=A0A1J5RBI8_9ZZZZ
MAARARLPSMKLAALIFDVDGTLADTERDGHRPAFNAAFSEAGLPWVWDEALYGELLAVTGGKERIRHYCARFQADYPSRPDFEGLVVELHRSKTRHYLARVEAGGIPLRPGVARLIGQARAAGLRLGVATTTSAENVSALLNASLAPDATNWFELIAAGDVVPAKKPAPDIYQYVLARMELPAGACLALEDSGNGLAASRAAGIPTVVTVNDYSRGQDFAGALAVLPDLDAVGLGDLLRLHQDGHL